MSLKRFFVSNTKNKEMDGSEFFANFLSSSPSFSLSKVSLSLFFHHIDSNKHSGKQIQKKLCKKQSDLEWKRRKRLKGKERRKEGKERRRIGSRVWDFIPSSLSPSLLPFLHLDLGRVEVAGHGFVCVCVSGADDGFHATHHHYLRFPSWGGRRKMETRQEGRNRKEWK